MDLVNDSNKLIDREFEERRNRQSFSGSQARDRKPINLNLSLVDWSGFSASAHSPRNSDIPDRKQQIQRNADGKRIPTRPKTAQDRTKTDAESRAPVDPSTVGAPSFRSRRRSCSHRVNAVGSSANSGSNSKYGNGLPGTEHPRIAQSTTAAASSTALRTSVPRRKSMGGTRGGEREKLRRRSSQKLVGAGYTEGSFKW